MQSELAVRRELLVWILESVTHAELAVMRDKVLTHGRGGNLPHE